MYYLGLDTSNYSTSFSVVDHNGEVILSEKLLLPVAEGACGLRQSDAVFAHVKNIPIVFRQVKQRLVELCLWENIEGIGYSARPRDVEGSYMPCFLVGKMIAEVLSACTNKPLFSFSHQAGHIEAASYSAKLPESVREFYSFHVSGGTTELVCCRRNNQKFEIQLLGGCEDLHAGQLIDRIGVMLGCSFPAGPEIEKLAADLPFTKQKIKISVDGYSCHMSGFENMAQKMQADHKSSSEIAAFVLDAIAQTLAKLVENIRLNETLPVLFAGGVMANKRIQSYLGLKYENLYFAEPKYSSDNAAGIARLTYLQFH